MEYCVCWLDRSLATIAAWLGGVLALLGSIFIVRRLPPVSKPSTHLLILLAAIVAGIFGVILIHTAASLTRQFMGTTTGD